MRSASAGSRVETSPPSPGRRGSCREEAEGAGGADRPGTQAAASCAEGLAASSITGMPSASSASGAGRRTGGRRGWPASRDASATSAGSRFSEAARCRRRRACRRPGDTASAVAKNVNAGQITSSPGPTPWRPGRGRARRCRRDPDCLPRRGRRGLCLEGADLRAEDELARLEDAGEAVFNSSSRGAYWALTSTRNGQESATWAGNASRSLAAGPSAERSSTGRAPPAVPPKDEVAAPTTMSARIA